MQVQSSKDHEEAGDGRDRTSWNADNGSAGGNVCGSVLNTRTGSGKGRVEAVASRSSVRLVLPALLWSGVNCTECL